MSEFQIENKKIGGANPCFIIAEAGVNHNGDLSQAKKLVLAAKFAGADAVKFQTFTPENLVTKQAKMAEYQKAAQNNGGEKPDFSSAWELSPTNLGAWPKNLDPVYGAVTNQLDMLKKLALSADQFIELIQFTRSQNIIFLTTPHTPDVIDYLDPHVSAYKLSSSDFTNILLHDLLMATGKPLILSSGMTTQTEVDLVMARFQKLKYDQIALLQCTSNYPCAANEVNLNVIDWYKKTYQGLIIGFSDHTTTIAAGVAAIAKGAKVIEKHFTLNRNLPGPDHQASLEPDELAEYVSVIRQTEQMLGSDQKQFTASEIKTAAVGRKSLVVAMDLPVGTILTKQNLLAKRPAGGIDPLEIETVLGRRLKLNMAKDDQILLEHLDDLTDFHYDNQSPTITEDNI